ncbi:hypothetical protein MSG28_015211, partial [Choristoneura fumiferana]
EQLSGLTTSLNDPFTIDFDDTSQTSATDSCDCGGFELRNNFRSPRLNEEEISSQSSDEKMDTGTESLHSRQHTPSSTLSSDYEDMEQLNGSCDVLRLQNHGVLRLSEPKELNDSLIKNMNNLQISSPVETRPKHLAVTKFSSTLMSTTDHPLMGIASPDENYPDLIPKKYKEDEKDLSLSSIEDERANETNEYFYSPQRNTSKNNLYINENFITAESHILSTTLDVTSPPDVARGIEKRKRLEKETPRLNRVGLEDLDSPDVISSSQEDRSAYQALLDPYTGSVMLRHTPAKSPGGQRRRIQLRVVSHGGYDGAGAALIVYVIWTLERLVTDEYVLVYLYGSAGPRRLPTAHWLREYYKLVDRRLRKSLKHLYLVHPTYGLRLFVTFTKAFVSNFRSPRLNEEEISSQSSDEKMDTGTESLHSRQHTPSSTLSSDYEDMEQLNGSCDVLRLQNHGVLRLSEPKNLTTAL